MSVFKRDGSVIYSYDFRFRGRRFSGSTGKTNKREADQFEKARQEEARNSEIDTNKPLSFSAAASLYWTERGQHHSDPSACERNIRWLEKEIGKATLISTIDDAVIARLVVKRRGEGVQPATINISVTRQLRAILNRAEIIWSAKVKRIQWKNHILKEPQERIREASLAEEHAMLNALPPDYRPVVRFAIGSGCRRAEIVGLRWTDVDFARREFRVTGKGDKSRTVPMTEEICDLLRSLEGDHHEAVFTFLAQRTRDGRVCGNRYPITAHGLNTTWFRHAKPVLKDFRFHDTRHTAATRLVRATGNLKLAQQLLGHTTLAMTSRYAHVSHDDLRAGLEAAVRAQKATETAAGDSKRRSKVLKFKKK